MVDPRERRGIRHGLTVVLTTTVCAVVAGARSFVAVAEWVADLPTDLAVVLGVDQRCPSESAIRRLIGKVDADRFDTVIGAFVQTLTAAVTPAGRRCVLAVDGKSLRGSRHTDADETTRPVRHLLAAMRDPALIKVTGPRAPFAEGFGPGWSCWAPRGVAGRAPAADGRSESLAARASIGRLGVEFGGRGPVRSGSSSCRSPGRAVVPVVETAAGQRTCHWPGSRGGGLKGSIRCPFGQ